MAAALPTFAPFSLGGDPAKAKLLVLGPASPALIARSRSLTIEHVSAAGLLRQEISRRTTAGRQAERWQASGQPVPDEPTLSLLRRWFWTRKPDAGFVLSDFPATLLQAYVFDEWLEARDTALDAVLLPHQAAAAPELIDHYRTLGLALVAADALAA